MTREELRAYEAKVKRCREDEENNLRNQEPSEQTDLSVGRSDVLRRRKLLKQ